MSFIPLVGVFVSTIPIGLVGLSEAGPLKFVQVCDALFLGPETLNPNPDTIISRFALVFAQCAWDSDPETASIAVHPLDCLKPRS
jgi:hypothetical protein